MIKQLLLVASLFLAQGARSEEPNAAPTPNPVAALFVPHPDAMKAKIKGSALEGFTPWFATKTSQRWPWVVLWSGDLAKVPVAFTGARAESDWATAPNAQALAGKPGDLFGTLDLAYVYEQLLVGAPQAARLQLQRAGVASISRARGYATIGDDHAVNTQVTLTLTQGNRGFFDALGAPAPAVWPATVPPKASHWTAARVVPGKVWEMVETMAGLSAPIPYGLARAHLDLLEDSMKVRWREDILGYAPQTWSLYVMPTGDRVLALGIQKGAAAAAFVREALSATRQFDKELTFEETKTSAATSWRVRSHGNEAHVAVAGDMLVIASNAEALTKHLAFHGTTAPMADAKTAPAPAVVWGVHDDSQTARWLGSTGLDGAFRAASKSVGAPVLTVKDATKFFGRSEWWMDPIPEGFGISILTRAGSGAAHK